MAAFRTFFRRCLTVLALPLLTAASEGDLREIPISIDVITQLDFSRAAHTGQGDGGIALDAASGTKRIDGGLIDLGGYGLAGTAIVHGEPGRGVRIDMPGTITMSSSTGGQIEITNLRTNLSAAPRIDSFGQLAFSFGGNVRVTGDASGTFRGRIPITAEYE